MSVATEADGAPKRNQVARRPVCLSVCCLTVYLTKRKRKEKHLRCSFLKTTRIVSKVLTSDVTVYKYMNKNVATESLEALRTTSDAHGAVTPINRVTV